MLKNKELEAKYRAITFFITVFLLVIDWTRGSQAGEVWKWTVNMTGVLVTILVCSVWGLDGFRKRKRVYLFWALLGPLLVAVTYIFWWTHQTVGYRDQLLSAGVAVWSLGFLYIRLFCEVFIEKVRKIHISISQGLLMLMLALAFFSVNEDIWPLFFLLIFFVVYQVIEEAGQSENEDLKQQEKLRAVKVEIRKGLIDAIICMFFVIQGHAFVLRPFDHDHARYCGFYANSNMNALFYCIVYVAFLIRGTEMIEKAAQSRWMRCRRLLCFFFSAAMWGFVFLTGCKTAFLAMIGISVLFIIGGKLMLLKEKAHIVFGKILIFLFIATVSVPVDYAAVRYLPPLFHHPIWFQGEYSDKRVHSWDPWDSDKYITFDYLMERMKVRYLPYLRFGGVNTEVYAAEVTFTSPSDGKYASVTGRTDLWKYYLANGKLFGHSNKAGHDIVEGTYIWHTQNMFVQFWYYYGILAALAYAGWLGYTFIRMSIDFVRLISNEHSYRDAQINCLAILCYLALFGIYGIPEAVWYPGQFILFMACFLPVIHLRNSK